MVAKKYGPLAADGGTYAVLTDGQGTLATTPTSTSSSGGATKLTGKIAPDGSLYIVLTDGSGNLV